MSIFLIKSILSIIVAFLALLSIYTMFEVFGRKEKRYDTAKLVKIHRISGIIYFLILIIIALFCLKFIMVTGAELSARATVHGLAALLIAILFLIKLSYIRIYRRFYEKAKNIGILIAILSFIMIGSSSAYYFVITKFGTDMTYDKIIQYREKMASNQGLKTDGLKLTVRTDQESIKRGAILFEAKCSFCHAPYSTETIVGPGLKGILKNPVLPVSKRPASPENIRRQLRRPFNRMPSFEDLTETEVSDIIAFLNTL
jgi:hypothetical protein